MTETIDTQAARLCNAAGWGPWDTATEVVRNYWRRAVIASGKYTRPTSQDAPVDHPPHYGGDNPYEAIRVIEAWGLGFCDGNVVKYLARWRQKGGVEDLEKARWYLDRFIAQQRAEMETQP